MKHKEGHLQKRNIFFIVCIAVIVLFLVFMNAYIIVNAENKSKTEYEKLYKSITIQQNQTLWDIAEEYYDDNYYRDMNEYIDEIMEINQLQSDLIHEGRHLIIVYIE